MIDPISTRFVTMAAHFFNIFTIIRRKRPGGSTGVASPAPIVPESRFMIRLLPAPGRSPFLRLATVFGLLFCLSFSTAHGQRKAPDAEDQFQEAFRLYADGLFEQAARGFGDFRSRHGAHPLAPEALYYEAESALALGREAYAMTLFRAFREQYPIHPLAYQAQVALGKYLYESGNYERAIAELAAVLETDPPYQIGAQALYLMGEAAVELGRIDEGLAYFQRIVDEYRQSNTAPVALYAIGYTQVQQRRFEEAARTFELLEARHPDSPYARNMGLALAEVYYELRDYARTAHEAERRLPLLSPDARERATFLLAEAYNHLGRSEDAIINYRAITEQNPSSPYYRNALYGLAWNYHRESAYQWAADHFAHVRENHNDDLAGKATYYEAVNRKLAEDYPTAKMLFAATADGWPELELAQNALLELGITHYELREWSDAQATLERLLREHPTTALRGEALNLRGNVLIALGRMDQAMQSFEEAISMDATPVGMRDEMAFQQAWLLYRNGDYRRSAPAFIAIYERDRTSAKAGDALFWAAESYFQIGTLDRAATLFRRYLNDFPRGQHIEAGQYALGWTYFRLSRYNEAITMFERFLANYRTRSDFVPYRTDATLRLADSYYASRRFQDAIRVYSRVAEEGGDYALYQIGQAQNNSNNPHEAIRTFRRLLSDFRESDYREAALYNVAFIYFQLQDFEQAASEFQRLVNDYPRSAFAPRALYGVGDAHFNAERYEDAINAYKRVRERCPNSAFAADAASGIQYALLALGDDRRADAMIEEFIAQNPNSPAVDELRFRQAEVRLRSGRSADALSAFQRFVQSSSDQRLVAEAHYYIGSIHADRRETQQAEAAFRRVVTNYPQSPRRLEAGLRLGRLLLDQNRAQDALAAYRDAEAAASGNPAAVARARYGQGMSLLAMGRTADAEQLLQQTASSAGDQPEALPAMLGLARIYDQSNRPNDALNLYRRVAERSRDENGAEALYRMGDLLLRRGNARQAVEELSRMPTLFPGQAEWLPQGYLVQARAFRSLGQRGDAQRIYDRIISEYPGTRFAESAAQERAAL
jgi:TolA-binding protein